MYRPKIILFFILIFCGFKSLAQRQIESINDGWRFYKGDMPNAADPSFNDAAWEQINLPHTWNAKDGYETKDYYRGVGWYRRKLKVSDSMLNKKVYLKFGAALLSATVFVNGKLVGHHQGGYTAFVVDISSFCITNNALTIAVRVDNSQQQIAPLSGDFTLFGGLYRNVWLIATSPLHFDMENMASKGVFVQTPAVSEKEATVAVKGTFANDFHITKKIIIINSVATPAGKIISKIEQSFSVAGNSKKDFLLNHLAIPTPLLWSPETPSLYTVKTQLVDAVSGKVLDAIENPLGFRWFHFDPSLGFSLNGKPYKLLGVACHQDQIGLGSALNNQQHHRDIRLIKEMGANFLRISHYPQDETIVEECDRVGILTSIEIPVVDMISDTKEFYQNTEYSLREMIRQYYNHSSVILWGYMNEIMLGTLRKIPEPLRPRYMEATRRLEMKLDAIAHQEDSLRLTFAAQHNSPVYDSIGLSSIPDVLGWNLYQGWYEGDVSLFGTVIDEQHKNHPDRTNVISEYGAGSDTRLHSLAPTCFDFSVEYMQQYHEAMLPMIKNRSYIAGSVVWNFIDFGSANREESMPHINNKGLVFANRTPKDIYYYYKAALRQDPVLYIASREWLSRTGIANVAGDTTVTQPVKIYTNLSGVQLFMNDTSIGYREVVNNAAVWQLPFKNGNNTVEVIGEKDGKILKDYLNISFDLKPVVLKKIATGFELGINVGSNCYFTDDQSGFTWVPDKAYTPGSWGYVEGTIQRSFPERIGIQVEIKGTRNIPLYQTARKGLKAYKFDVPDGEYEVTLGFAEPGANNTFIINDLGFNANNTKDNNVFSVSINGCEKISALDLLHTYGAVTAVDKTFIISTEQGKGITIDFTALKGETLLSAIKIRCKG